MIRVQQVELLLGYLGLLAGGSRVFSRSAIGPHVRNPDSCFSSQTFGHFKRVGPSGIEQPLTPQRAPDVLHPLGYEASHPGERALRGRILVPV
jgi:hypothetical protein